MLAAGIGYVYLSDPMPQMAGDAAQDEEAEQTDHQQEAGDGSKSEDPEAKEAQAGSGDADKNQKPGEDSMVKAADASAPTSEESKAASNAGKLVADEGVPDPAEKKMADPPAKTETPAEVAAQNDENAPDGAEKPAMEAKTAEAEQTPEAPAKADVPGKTVEQDGDAKSEAEPVEPKIAAVQATPEDAPAEKTTAPDSTQQAALPKVLAPVQDSLPLWQRNRQRIDHRWLKDSAGKAKPRVAFILTELGLAPRVAEEIIRKLPPGITLSFSPYAKPQTLEYLSALARSSGHEVMLDLPLEPIDFPQRDPGPKALLTALEPQENLERLDWSLGRSTGYVGVAVWMGSRFVGSPRQMQPLMEAIEEKGLLYLDNAEREDSLGPGLASQLGIPTVTSHRYVDVPLASRDAIDARLAQVERIALQFGSAVAMGRPFPVTVERLAEWAAEIEKRGIVLVPVTVLGEETVRRQNLAERSDDKKTKTKTDGKKSKEAQ